MATESRSLVALGPRIPEMLGNFHLDDHNVEEWSDATGPGVRHKARKEMGKWINPDSNADIQYQKHEDCKQSDRSKEQSRTEVIQGQAPDSTFQIVHSHQQFQDVGDSNNSRVQTSTTSYQMSSSRGVRSTSKSTSNRTTTKTVTVSGGRTDDFENLKMSFQPLDTSTQRERINVSRSGTMGVRRPPTRRHTPAAALSSSPEDDNIDTRDDIIVDSDDNMRSTPEFNNNTRLSDQTGLSIVGFKNISPKIRVGFPMEIQLELQTKLRGSANRSRCNDDEDIRSFGKLSEGKNSGSTNHPTTTIMQEIHKDIEQVERIADDSAISLFELSANNADSTFDFKQRRKSYGFDSFDSHTKQSERSNDHSEGAVTTTSHHDILPMNSSNPITFHHPIITDRLEHISGLNETTTDGDDNSQIRSATHFSRLSPSSISRSWDLIQSAHTAQQRREANKKLFNPSTMSGLNEQSYDTSESNLGAGNYSQRNSSQKTVVTLNASEESNSLKSRSSRDMHPMNSLESLTSSQISHSTKRSTVAKQDETDSQVGCTPDVLHHDHDESTLSPSLERSRKLLKLLDETPDLLHKMSYKTYFTDALKAEGRYWEDKEGTDWETQRQLSFLNDSLSRILDDGRSKEGVNNEKTGNNGSVDDNYVNDEDEARMEFPSSRREEFDDSEVDFNGNVKNRISQVSQTWISSGDPQKPSQKVRDNDVTTSISATNDPFKRGPKKVEFCKTEVHFTADSGKFHIVETDENKPSTSHLFRKKKKGDKGKQSSLASTSSSASSSTVQETISNKSDLGIESSQTEMMDRKEIINDDSKLVRKETKLMIKTEEDCELKSDVGVVEGLLLRHRSGKGGKSEQDETISRGNLPTTSITSTPHLLAMESPPTMTYTRKDSSGSGCSSTAKSLPLLSLHKESLSNEGEEVFEKSHIVMSLNDVGGDEDMHSPSHMILSNFGEMKIQRYLKQLKSPSSQNGSESPTELFDLVPDTDHDHPSHFRFDNVLYENGSFVPLATRRSLIEMNNRNRKRNTTSQTSGNSSTMSNYSLPNSDKDNSNSTPASSSYQPLRLARMEAKVATARAKPQITSVELRYELENERPYNPEPIVNRQLHLNLRQQTEKENRTYVPAPVMPPELKSVPAQRNGKFSYSSTSPDESSNRSPSHELLRNAKPPTPILPVNYSKGAALRERFYYKNPSCGCDDDDELEETSSQNRITDRAMSASSVTSKTQAKSSSRSIVTIGDYDVGHSSRHGGKSEDYVENSEALSPEPVLSMDHTWKGPAHFENENANGTSKTAPVIRSLTFPKSNRSEPEWVSKARSRETRVTDWDLIGKQSGVDTPTKTEPPWMEEIIRFRSKSSTSEEVKTLPKISVVYPWQRDTASANSRPLEEDKAPEIEELEEESHIVSIVPAPPMLVYREQSDGGSRYTKSLAVVEAPKSVPANLTVLEISKRDIVDRDSDSILINPTQILKKDESFESNGKNRLKLHGNFKSTDEKSEDSSTLISKKHTEGTTFKRSQNPDAASSPPNLISAKARQTSKSSSKDQQTHSIKTDTTMTINKSSKNPKPPLRISSLNKADADSSQPSLKSFKSINTLEGQRNKNTSSLIRSTVSTAQKEKGAKKGTLKKTDVEESSGSSRSNTPIHRHPMVKVSKLPIRKNVSSKGTESKPVSASLGSRVKNKEKHQVAMNSDTKQSQSGKSNVMEGTCSRSRDSSSSKNQSTTERRNVDQKYFPKGPSSNRKK